MSWAARRQFIILFGIGATAVAFFAVVSIAVFYEAPSCSDGKRNQAEDGIDCGGPCAYFCAKQKQPPTVLFAKAIQNGTGRIDVIARIENKNHDAAAKNVQYDITLYGTGQALIQKVTGKTDLPPGSSVPIFAPNIQSGKQTAVNAFLDIEESSLQWFAVSSDSRIMPTVSNIKHVSTSSTPRIDAILTNPGVSNMVNVKIIILVRNDQGNVIAASSTIVPIIYAQEEATATFTWNDAFPSTPTSIEVVPIIPLP